MCGEKVEIVYYYDKQGITYQKDLYYEGIWCGIEQRIFATPEEAKKMGYNPIKSK